MDYFNTGNSLENNSLFLQELFFEIYDHKPTDFVDTFYGLNLQWPTFDLPENYKQYFLSFHTEYIDLDWVVKQAQRVYPCKVLVVADYEIDPWPTWSDNIETVVWITLHKQIKKLTDQVGIVKQATVPKYKISSLSFRISQYKKFVTAYLLKHVDPNDMILTYHANLGKTQDLHDHPAGIKHLENLNFDIEKTIINFNDSFTGKIGPVKNGYWDNPAYTDSLINLTNESFHYSQTICQDRTCVWPGPYITEKTFKPLLAGRSFLAVGQYQTYSWFKKLGLRDDFGFDISYDNDPGDLTRIGKLFNTLNDINQRGINDLYKSSLAAVNHNLDWINSGNLYDACQHLNQLSMHKISEF